MRNRKRWMLSWLGLVGMACIGAAGCGSSLPQMPVVSISPNTVSLQAGGGTQQFTAVVSNAGNTAVVWKVDGQMNGDATTGTVSQTGLYSAPAAVPQGGTVTVEAVSVANANATAAAVVTLEPPVGITLTPASATVGASGTVQFQANVTNATNTAVTWAVNGTTGGSASVGTISTAGLYTAPATFPGLQSVTVSATSVADPDESAKAVVTLTQTVTVTVNPPTATVATGKSTSFTASVTGSTDTTVVWSVGGAVGGNATLGTIDANGVYTAPATVPNPATVTITATSNANKAKSGSAQLTIVKPVAVNISPATATVNFGATQTFTATVANSDNPAVTWAVNGATGGNASLGTISTAGVYTAPASAPGTATISVTATSVADPTASAAAAVTLQAPIAVTISPTTATVNLGTTQAFQATVTGGGGANTAVTWSVNGIAGGNATVGTVDTKGVFTAPTAMPTTPQETVTATSQADANQSASAQVTLQVPPNQFTLSPASSTLSLGKAASGTVTLTVAAAAGFNNPVQFAVSGAPVNVSSSLSPASLAGSGTVTLTLATAPISLAVSAAPITITATSTDASGNKVVQTATVALTITGWAGHVSTLAGGPGGTGYQDGSGTQDELYATAITSDGANTVFFADKAGHALRQLSLTNQAVTTLVGGPYAYTIGEGGGLAYDAATQTVYAADVLRNRIVAFTLGGYDVTLVAGGANAGYADGVGAAAEFESPHGLALSPDGKTLYVADTSNEVIRKIDLATDTVTTLAGQHGVYRSTDGLGTAAAFCQPTGLAIDPAGADLYVSDQCGYVIRQIALTNVQVTTVAGTGAQGASDGPAADASFSKYLGGLAVDPHPGANVVYIADNNAIRALRLGSTPVVYTVAGRQGSGQSDGSGAAASFYQPVGITAIADAQGSGTTSLFVADSLNGLLRRIDITNPLTATSSSNVVAQVATLAGQPSDRGSTDGVGTGTDYSGASVAQFDKPEGIITDGKVAYVADSLNGAIRKIDLSTTQVTTIAGPHLGYEDGPAADAAFYQNAGLALSPDGNTLYIADTGNAVIRALDLAAGTVSTIAGSNTQAAYVDGPVAQARFNHPFGILVSPDGAKLYIADTGNNVIRMIDLTTHTVSTIAGNGGLGSADGVGAAARFAEPNGLAWNADHTSIFISDFENAAIRELNLATDTVTTLVGMNHTCGSADGAAATASLCDPAFIASDGRSLFWGDSELGLLRVLDLGTMQVYTLAGKPGLMHMQDGDFVEQKGTLTGPVRYNDVFGIAIDPSDNFILFTDMTANVVRIIH